MRMKLKGRSGDTGGDGAFEGIADRLGLATAGRQKQNLSSFKNRTNSHSDRHAWNLIEMLEEACIILSRRSSQRLDAGSTGKTGPRFVEGDMTIGPYPQQLKVDAARLTNRLIVSSTSCSRSAAFPSGM